MDVNLLSKLLRELIIDNEQVSLSGIGYFTTEPVPAFFSEDGKTIFPPSRKIHFKGDERTESDMIWKFYSKEYGIENDTAKHEVETFMKQLLLTFLNKKSIELPGFGRLVCTNDGEYHFFNESDGGIFPQAFGFEPVSLRPSGKQLQNCPGPEAAPALPDGDGVGGEVEKADSEEILHIPDTTEQLPTAEDDGMQIENGETSAQNETDSIELLPTEQENTETTETSGGSQKKRLPLWAVILIIAGTLLLLAVAFVLLSRTGMLDGLLYSDEELQLLKNTTIL